MAEVLTLYPLNESGKSRNFDAMSDGNELLWQGVANFDDSWEPPRVYVFVDRQDPLGDSYACKPGSLEEIIDDRFALNLITRALTGMPCKPIGSWTKEGFIPNN